MFENSGTAPLFAAYEYARKYIKVSFSSLESHLSLPRKKIENLVAQICRIRKCYHVPHEKAYLLLLYPNKQLNLAKNVILLFFVTFTVKR